MRQLLFPLLLLSTLTYSAQSQDMAGAWEGYLDQSEAATSVGSYREYWDKGVWKRGMKTHDLKLTFQAKEDSKNNPTNNQNLFRSRLQNATEEENQASDFIGEYYINEVVQPAHFARFALMASYKNNQFQFEAATKLFEVKNSLNLGFCYSRATLSYSQDEYYEYLAGDWEGWEEDSSTCPPAKVWLRRLKDPNKLPPAPDSVEELPKVQPLVEVNTPPVPPTPEEPPTPIIVAPPVRSTTLQYYDNRSKVTKEVMNVVKDSVTIDVWDGNREDGDIISLVFNGEVLLEEHRLTKIKRHFKVALKKGQNILTLIAHNLGDIPPNTAALEVERNEGRRKIQLSSDMSRSESVLIIKE